MVWAAIIALAAGVEGSLLLSVAAALLFIHRACAGRRIVPSLVAFLIMTVAFSLGRDGRGGEAKRVAAEKRFLARLEAGRRPLSGWVADFPRERFGREYFRFRIRTGSSIVAFSASCPYASLEYGDSLRITGYRVVGRAGRKAGPLRLRGASAPRHAKTRIQARRIEKPGGARGSALVRSVFWPIHRSMRETIQRRMGRDAAVPLALTLGERIGVSRSMKDDLRRLGISHLFALSGMHLGIVALIAFYLFSPLTSMRSLLVLVVLGAYVGAAGDLASLHRAFAMVVAASAARLVQRPVHPETLVGDAVFVLLVLDPMDLHSVSLQMSFAATFAIMRSLGRSGKRNRQAARPRAVDLLLALRTGLYAQAFVAPIALYYFGGVSVFSAPATLLFLPAVFLIMSATFAGCLLETVLPHVSEFWFSMVGGLVRLFGLSLHAIASHVPHLLQSKSPNLVLCYAGLLILTSRGMKPVRALLGITVLTASFIIDSPTFPL